MEITQQSRMITLAGVLLALFLGALDQTIVATALPRIARDLQGLGRYAWVATAYLLTSTVLIPIYGKLADIHNRKAIELWSIGIFLGGSFLCGLSGEFGTLPILGDGMSQLIIFRGLQGLGSSGLFAMAFIVISDLFPPAERGRYQGFVGAVFGIASVLGPLFGGLLTDYGSAIIPGISGWRWVFYVNLPFGILALWFIISRMPSLHPRASGAKFSYLSALLLVLAVVPLILALELDKSLFPWGGAVTLSLLAAAAVALALFILHSRYDSDPILDLSLFKNKVFSISNGATLFMGATFLGIIIFLPLFMVNVLGVSATNAGLSIIPLSVGLFIGSVGSGQIVSRVGHYRIILIVSAAVLVVGTILLSFFNAATTFLHASLVMFACGIGLGPGMPLYTLAIQNAVDVRKIGQATSASQFFRQIGGTVGAAILGTVLATSLSAAFAHNMPAGMASGHSDSTAAVESQFMSGPGGATPAQQIAAGFDDAYGLIVRVVKNGDRAALAQLQQNPYLPSELKSKLASRIDAAGSVAGGASDASDRGSRTDPTATGESAAGRVNGAGAQRAAATDRLLATIKARFGAQAKLLGEQVTHAIKLSFAEAISRIYFWVIFIALAGLLVTLFIPELPLRRTFEHHSGPPPAKE